MTEFESPAVAFIGLGAMGLPMATRLVQAGVSVRGYDVSSAARTAVEAAGAEAAETPELSVDGADVVILMLPNSEIVEEVVGAIRSSMTPGALLVDMSSSEPLRTRSLAEQLAPEIAMVDAPVSGGVTGARDGKLTIMTGGETQHLARARRILDHLGAVKEAGGIGAGHAVKALNNLLSATHLWVTSEAMHAGARFGLAPEAMLEIFNGSSGRSGSTDNKWPNFILPGRFDSGFALGLMLKDMRIATALAAEVGLSSELGEAAVNKWAEAEAGLSGAADHTEVARWISGSD